MNDLIMVAVFVGMLCGTLLMVGAAVLNILDKYK
jgi:hypothetical protein